MSTSRTLEGVVLAGGYSTRFGETDKAVADLAGTPLIRRVVDRLAAVTDAVVINCRDDQREAIQAALSGHDLEVRYAIDPVPDRGPLAGIAVGLEAVDREYAAVVACDMPFVEPALFEQLYAHARGHDGAVVRLEDGWYQPTQAVYRAESMARACEETLGSDDTRILAAFDSLDVVTVEEAALEGVSETTFESVDTPDDLRAAAHRLEEVSSR
ncbi:molybdenum cofactor guanylyltransferase [Natronorubrum sulfidifaciens]|uniref:Probable molybdenum cofactor guanylyltransferase n=1 Tax=Natronorubrum sulfidifaciens JCM 14089 TaxID=1230460 RepID=L9VXX7_9EURY|nr:molybdenum cofactor guanylyltransferase [Natronorubrum sulfidifaciens]ELY42030.1 molybdopterin-guanine dinucleotide biosynthesis protein A [Natronorubrum sulfidifaciens JCM 14089]